MTKWPLSTVIYPYIIKGIFSHSVDYLRCLLKAATSLPVNNDLHRQSAVNCDVFPKGPVINYAKGGGLQNG